MKDLICRIFRHKHMFIYISKPYSVSECLICGKNFQHHRDSGIIEQVIIDK